MDFSNYLAYFEGILKQETPPPPYDNSDYIDYTKLNWSRMQRWLKTGVVNAELHNMLIESADRPMEWIIITEPWCGDAAHSVPMLEIIAAPHAHITTRYELRDTEPFLINQYLTNGSKSIPKLIVRDLQGNDLATWGPRPAECQELYSGLLQNKADFETIKTELQKWYNHDKGVSLQQELIALLQGI